MAFAFVALAFVDLALVSLVAAAVKAPQMIGVAPPDKLDGFSRSSDSSRALMLEGAALTVNANASAASWIIGTLMLIAGRLMKIEMVGRFSTEGRSWIAKNESGMRGRISVKRMQREALRAYYAR